MLFWECKGLFFGDEIVVLDQMQQTAGRKMDG